MPKTPWQNPQKKTSDDLQKKRFLFITRIEIEKGTSKAMKLVALMTFLAHNMHFFFQVGLMA
jgi:hypothetical protein